jgi:hypothetical protein
MKFLLVIQNECVFHPVAPAIQPGERKSALPPAVSRPDTARAAPGKMNEIHTGQAAN